VPALLLLDRLFVYLASEPGAATVRLRVVVMMRVEGRPQARRYKRPTSGA
jgi:uncharacterized membrane protein